MSGMAELKPCPFCGGTEIRMYSLGSSDLHGFVHLCEINGEDMVKVESRFFETEEEAVEAWNRRSLNVPDTNVGDIISRKIAKDTNVPSTKCISQQAAIDGVKTLHDIAWKNYHEPTLSANAVLDMIRELPAVQPQRRKGAWHVHAGGAVITCGECGERTREFYAFCPYCGTDMRKELEQELEGDA